MRFTLAAAALLCLAGGCVPEDAWTLASGLEHFTAAPASPDPSPTEAGDLDGDGALDALDCAPGDPGVFPGAPERCDDVDQDCDARLDEAPPSAAEIEGWYLDEDGDSFGGAAAPADACARAPLVRNALDCDDQDPGARPDSLWGSDVDGDGWGAAPGIPSCMLPLGYAPLGDCDDSDPDVYGQRTWYEDKDGDGFGHSGVVEEQCADLPGYVLLAGDCDDTDAAISPQAPGEISDNGADDDCDGLILIGEGVFPMGSLPQDTDTGVGDPDAQPDEQPARWTAVGPYLFAVTEVSVAEYAACVEAGACDEPDATCLDEAGVSWAALQRDREDHPVVCVTGPKAANLCAWRGGRLPTEAEWEAAARGTCPSGAAGCAEAGDPVVPIDGALPYPIFPTGDEAPACEQANYKEADYCEGETVAVGELPAGASPTGALHMAGNVYEWTGDAYGPYGSAPIDPSSEGIPWVTRGGWFKSTSVNVRTGSRGQRVHSEPGVDVGFRCVWDVND